MLLFSSFLSTSVRKREWHGLAEAKRILQLHKPIQATYISVMDGTNKLS